MISFLSKFWGKMNASSKVTYLPGDYRGIRKNAFKSYINLFNVPFRDCVYQVLVIVQLMGLMPFNFTEKGDCEFKFRSLKYIYSMLVAITILGLSILSFMKVLRDNMEFDKIITFLFYFVDFLVVIQFQVLATQWGNIMTVWTDFERALDPNEHLLGKRLSMKVTFQVVILLVTLMTVIAEVLAFVAGMEKGAECVGVSGEYQRYYRQQFPQVFAITEYTVWKGALLQLIQFICTFVRMYLDVFLVLISIGLCRLNARLNLQFNSPRSNRVLTEDFWARYKERYLKYMELVKFVDERIGHLIILCFLSDLYLICIRILNSLKSLDTIRHALYFWYALIFLILRLVYVCFFAANLHEEAKRPLTLLRSVPASLWSLEAQRFQDLVTNNDVCLTGMGYFKMRRTLLLSISGTIVTYELVLMQFNDSGSLEPTDKNPCS